MGYTMVKWLGYSSDDIPGNDPYAPLRRTALTGAASKARKARKSRKRRRVVGRQV